MTARPARATTTPHNKTPTTLLRWRERDTNFGITKSTAEKAAELLGISETQLIHQALASFVAREVPHYDPDFDPLTDTHYAAIRKRVDQTPIKKASSSLL